MLRSWLKSEITTDEAWAIRDEWIQEARGAQYPLSVTTPTWMVVGGRGAGKTRLGAEWLDMVARGLGAFGPRREGLRIALVGDTLGDVREVMIEGASGVATLDRAGRPRYEPSRRRLVWPNGTVAQAFSSEDPESLRGPQFDAAWCDELGKWRHAEACFDMLQFGLRLGQRPLQLITTTPRPSPLMRRLVADPMVKVTRMRTQENAGNLASEFIATIERRYRGTRLGRQEIEGELIEDRDDALWSRTILEQAVVRGQETPSRIVVALDPPASSGRNSDACGIIAAGRIGEDRAVVLEDASIRGATPVAWAQRAVALYHRLDADCIVAEVNQGGEMVSAVLRTVDPTVPVRERRAMRGKWLRAEPVAALYAQGRVAHARRFPELEDEMCNFGPDGLSDGRSPDRLDALVWAIGELLLTAQGKPQVRSI